MTGVPAPAPLQLLYVEDNRVNALLFVQLLAQEPRIQVQLAEDGAEALALLAGWTPDVLVLDNHLPDTTGHALLAQLRGLPGLQHTPAFMCTADDQPEDRQRALTAGFAGFWTKPVNACAVLDALLAIAAQHDQRPG